MRIGVCASPESIQGSYPLLTYVEVTGGDVLCMSQDEEAFAKRLATASKCKLPVLATNTILPPTLKTTGPDVDQAKIDAHFIMIASRSARVGAKIVVYGSGGSRTAPQGFPLSRAREQIAGNLARWGDIAASFGLVLAMEPLNTGETNVVNTIEEGAELVAAANKPSVRLLVDTYHMARNGESERGIIKAAGLVVHAHCAEGKERDPLGTTGEDHRRYFRALKDIGYDGTISIEARWKDFAAQLPAAIEELHRQIETC